MVAAPAPGKRNCKLSAVTASISPVDRLDAAQSFEPGQLIRRAVDLRAAMKLGVTVCLDEVAGDEFYAMILIEEERERLERETVSGFTGTGRLS